MQLQRLVFPASSYISQSSPLRGPATPPPTLANSSTQRSGTLTAFLLIIGAVVKKLETLVLREKIAERIPGVNASNKALDKGQILPEGFLDQRVY